MDGFVDPLASNGLEGFSDPLSVQPDQKPEAEPGDYLRGLKQYGPQMQQMWGAGKAVLGKAIDSPSLIESGIGSMKEAEGKLQSIGSKPTDEITGVNSVGDFVDWAQHGLGQVTGNLAESALTAGAGALLGSLGAPGVGTAGGAATGLIGKSIVKGALKEQAEKIARDYGVDAANSFVAKNVARTVGTNAGLAGGALYHGVGETGSRAFEEAGYDPSKVDLSQVLPASAAHAGAEYFGDKILLGGLLGENAYRAAGNGVMPFAKTVLGNAAQVAGKEIPVEMFQTGAERYAAGLPLANEEAGKEYLNTAAQTALFGVAGVPGGVRSYLNKETSPSAQQAQPQTEATPAEQDQSINEMSPLVDQFNGLSQTPALDYNGQPSVITVPTQEGGQTTIDRNAGPLSAAVVDTGVSDMLNTGMPLRSYPNRADAQAALDARDDADRMTIAPHPRANGRFAVVPKDRLTLQAIDQAAARNQQLSEEEGNASQVDATGNQGQRDNGTRGAGTASANAGIGSGGGQSAGASVGRGGTNLSVGSGNAGVGDVNAAQTQQMAAQTVATPAAQTGTQQTATPADQGVKEVRRSDYGDGHTGIEFSFGDDGFASVIAGPDGRAYVTNVQLGDAGSTTRGKGVGTAAYAALGRQLAAQGITLESTRWDKHKSAISPAALRVWQKLEAAGLARQTGEVQGKIADRFSGKEEVTSVPTYEFVAQPTQTTAQPSQQQQSADRRAVNTSSDSALVAIAKLGGVNTQELLSNGFDQSDISTQKGARVSKKTGQLGKAPFRARQVGFNLPIHSSNGLSFDGMREMLQQHGYLPEGASKNDMIELFRRSLTEDIHTPQATEQMAIEAAEARAAEMQAEEEANEASGYNDLETNREQQAADQLVEELFGEDAAAFSRGLRVSGVYTEDEIYAEVEKQFNQRAANEADSETSPQGRDRGGFEESRTDEEVFGGTETEDPFGVGATESADPFGLEVQTNEQAAADFAKQQAPEAISKEQIDREVSGFGLTQQSQPKPQGVQSGLLTADGRASVDADQSKRSRQRGRTPEQANADRAQRKANLEREQEPESNDAKVVNQAVKSNDAQIHAANDLPNSNEVGDRQVSRQQARFIEKVASMFGKRVVFFSSESAEQPDGFWNRGKTIYINVNSSVTQLRVLGHEMTHAMKKFAPEAYKNMLRAVSHLISNAELRAQYRNYYGKSEEAMSDAEIDAALKDKSTRDDIVEEWISDLAGNRFAESSFWSDVFTQIESQHGAQAAKTIIGKLRLALVNALNKIMSAIKGNKFAVDNRMAEHLDDIRKAIATGFTEYAKASQQGFPNQSRADGEVKFSPVKAWHGSPHDHNKFDSSKIGTGEGAQAFGWGHYFADKRELAEWYRDTLSKRNSGNSLNDRMDAITIDGKKVMEFGIDMDSEFADMAKENDLFGAYFHADKRASRWEELANDESYKFQGYAKEKAEAWRTVEKTLETAKEFYSGEKGRIYQVTLPEESTFLLWDKPLSEQTDEVKAAISEEENKRRSVATWLPSLNMRQTGEDYYKSQSEPNDKAASEYLKSIGINGIKYLDGQSRNAGDGNFNYVVFDDNDIQIDAKFSLKRSGNKPSDPILVNGSADIAQLPAEISARTNGRFLAKPIRLLNGRHYGAHRGYGFAHINAEHGSELVGDDPMKAARYAIDVVRNTTKIYDDGSGRLLLQSAGIPKGIAFVELRDHGEYYSVVTAFNGKERGKLVWSGRSLHLSSMGSGDKDRTLTATAAPSDSASARTDQPPLNPKRPLETLADQTSTNNLSPSNPSDKFSNRRQSQADREELQSIFAGLDSRGLARKRAEDKLDGIREIARVRYVQDSFLDILAELEDSGKVLINCD